MNKITKAKYIKLLEAMLKIVRNDKNIFDMYYLCNIYQKLLPQYFPANSTIIDNTFIKWIEFYYWKDMKREYPRIPGDFVPWKSPWYCTRQTRVRRLKKYINQLKEELKND